MKSYTVVLTRPAAKDIQNIIDYVVHNLLAPESAANLAGKFRDNILALSTIPYSHPLVTDERLARQGIKKLLLTVILSFSSAPKKPRQSLY